ncbi:unnamed protein product [Discula destructiva]
MLLPILLPLAIGFVGHASAANLTTVLAANADQLSTLSDTITRIPFLAQQLANQSDLTIFAPSNVAFEELASQTPNFTALDDIFVGNLLLYHAVPLVITSAKFNTTPAFVPTLLNISGPGIVTGRSATQKLSLQLTSPTTATVFSGFKQRSTVNQADILFDGGVVHIIDTVLTLPGTASATALVTQGLTSFYGALTETGMLGTVDTLRDATIFAPSNAAFEVVGSVVESASATSLMGVLVYHILSGTTVPGMPMFSTSLLKAPAAGESGLQVTMELATLAGTNVTVREDVDNGDLFINSAKIVTSDIITSNGVIHIIDNVLNPLAADAVPDDTLASQTPAFTSATPATAAPFTSGVSATVTFTPAATTGAAGPFAAVPTAALMAGGVAALWANM